VRLESEGWWGKIEISSDVEEEEEEV